MGYINTCFIGGFKMRKSIKSLADWKKEWQNSTDSQMLETSLDHIDETYQKVGNSLGRNLLSMEMMEIQEVLEERVEQLASKNMVAA